MFVYCEKCNYDSGDYNSMAELEFKIKNEGGKFNTDKDVCPKCSSVNSLHVD